MRDDRQGRGLLFLVGLVMCLWIHPAWSMSPAEQAMYAGEIDKALALTEAEAREHPTDMNRQEAYIDVLLTIGLAQQAQEYCRERVRNEPTNADAHYLLGRAVVTAEEARTSYEHALRINPDHARSHMGVAAIHSALGRTEIAKDAYKRALERDTSLSEAWMGLIRLHMTTGLLDEAVSTAREGLKYVKTEPGLYLTLAILVPEEADQHLKEGIDHVPEDPRLHAAQAEILLGKGKGDLALAAANQALSIDPKSKEALLSAMFAKELAQGWLDVAGYKGLLSAQQSLGIEELAGFERLASKYPRSSVVLLARARWFETSGQYDSAQADLKKVLNQDPRNVEAMAAYGLLLMSKRKDPKSAAPWLTKASNARPWDASLMTTRALALTQNGNWAEGKKAFLECVSKHPFEVNVVLLAIQELLNHGEAEEAYQIALGGAQRLTDPQIGVAFVLAATKSGHYLEAANILEQLGKQAGRQQLLDAAAALRKRASES